MPAEQSPHALAAEAPAAGANLPAVHEVHVLMSVAAVALEYVPAAQAVQSADGVVMSSRAALLKLVASPPFSARSRDHEPWYAPAGQSVHELLPPAE